MNRISNILHNILNLWFFVVVDISNYSFLPDGTSDRRSWVWQSSPLDRSSHSSLRLHHQYLRLGLLKIIISTYLRIMSLRLDLQQTRQALFSLSVLKKYIGFSELHKYLQILWHFSRFSSDQALSPLPPFWTVKELLGWKLFLKQW